jgi:hypothetical protein
LKRSSFLALVMLASSAATSTAAAQPRAGSEVTDPWRGHAHIYPRRMLIDLTDPWADDAAPELYRSPAEVLDPWNAPKKGKKATRAAATAPDVVDPWLERPVPTAAFPRGGARATATVKSEVPTAVFPLVDPWPVPH